MRDVESTLLGSALARLAIDGAARELREKENAVHEAAVAHEKKVAVTVRYAFAEGRAAIDRDALRAAETVDAADRAVSRAASAVHDALVDLMPSALLKALVAGGDAGLSLLREQIRAANARLARLKISFNAEDEDAIAWAEEHAAELARDISATTRENIAAAIVDAFKEGGVVRDAYDAILAAVGDETRAQLIARTETMTAANEGQRQAWSQAIDAGLLSATSKRVWITVGDDACPECQDLEGVEVALDEDYPNDGGDGPPLHPNCRCTEGIVS